MAQLDNATDSDSGEREFKSLRAGQKREPSWVPFFYMVLILLLRRPSAQDHFLVREQERPRLMRGQVEALVVVVDQLARSIFPLGGIPLSVLVQASPAVVQAVDRLLRDLRVLDRKSVV